LEASGGKLALEKCFNYNLSWQFDGNGRLYSVSLKEQRKLCPPISIPEEKENYTIMLQKDVSE
jgi:hypothetical protein